MEEEEYDSDNTVLLANYKDKHKSPDAKRRRLSNLHNTIQEDKYDDERSVPDNLSNNIRTDSPPVKQKNNTDKNLHVNKYLTGLGEIDIKNNKDIDFRIAPAPINLSKHISETHKDVTLKTSTNFDNDDVIICITSDDEDVTQNNEELNEDIHNTAVHKVYGDSKHFTQNKYGKLTVLKPAAINAQRATNNVFGRSEFLSNLDDSFRLDENKQPKIRVLNPSVINARRSTTSFEENFSTINETTAASKSTIIHKKLIFLPTDENENENTKETDKDDYRTPENSELPKTSPNATKEESCKMTGSSNVQVANTNTTVSVAPKTLLNNMNTFLNTNKRLSNEDNTLTESKRVRIQTKPTFTKQLQIKNVTFINEIGSNKLTAKLEKDQIEESNEKKNQNNTDNEQEKTEYHAEPEIPLRGLNTKLLKTVDKQQSSKLQDILMSGEHYEKEARVPCDMPGINSVENSQVVSEVRSEQETIRVHDEQVINKSHDSKQNKIEIDGMQEINAVHDQQVILQARDNQEVCKILKEQIKHIINKPHHEQQRCKVQDVGISQVHDMQETKNVQTKQISKPQNKQERVQDYEISEIHGKQETSSVQDKQIISNALKEQQRSKVRDNENSQIHDEQETSNVQDKQIISKPHNEPESSKVHNDEIREIRGIQETNEVQDKQIINKGHIEQERSKVQDDEISPVHDKRETNYVQGKQIISKPHTEHDRSKVQDDEISQIHDKQETSKLQDKPIINKPHNEQEISTVQDDEIGKIHGMQEMNNAQEKQIINEPHNEQGRNKIQYNEISQVCDKQEMNNVLGNAIICKPHHEQESSKIQDDENSQGHNLQETSNLQNKQIISRLHNEQESSKGQNDEIRDTHGMQITSRVQDKQVINKTHVEQETSKVPDYETSQVHDKQETNNVQDKQIISKPHNERKRSRGQNEKYDLIKTSKVHGKERITKLQFKQKAKKINDDQEKSDAIDTPEKNKRNEITLKVSSGGLKVNLPKFQVQFFTEIKEYIKKDYPESSALLHNFVQTLKMDAKNGKIHTDIKYSCPQCGHLSTYLASLHNDTDDKNVATAGDSQKCSLCQGFTKLYTSYMILYLQEVTAKNETKNPVENTFETAIQEIAASNSRPSCNKKSVADNLDSNTPVLTGNKHLAGESIAGKCSKEKFDESVYKVSNETDTEMRLFKEISSEKITVSKEDYICAINKICDVDDEALSNNGLITKKRLCNERIMDLKRKKIDAERNDAQNDKNLTILNTVNTSNSNFRRDVIDNNNEIPEITPTTTQGNIELSDKRPNKVIILSVQNVTLKNDLNKNAKHSCFKENHINISEETHVDGATLTNNIIREVSRKSDDSYPKEAGMSGSNIEKEINPATNAKSTKENTREKAANNLQTITTNISNVLDPRIKSKSYSTEEYREKGNKIVTEHANKMTKGPPSEKTSNKLYGKEIRNGSNEIETNKQGDNISNNATSEPSQTKADSNSDLETTTSSKEKDNTNENNLKALIDCFTTMKNNVNTKENKANKVKVHQESNKARPESASNLNNSFDKKTKTAVIEYICPECSCEYVHAAKLRSHMRNNHNLNLTTIPKNCIRRKCLLCNEPNIINYNKHVNRYHREFTVRKNESNNINQEYSGKNKNETPLPNSHNRINLGSISSKYKYHCSICDEILSSRYACRQHRKQKHPDFKNQPIYKKVISEDKEKIYSDNEELNAAIVTRTTRKENKVRVRSEENNNKHEHAGQSDTTTVKSISMSDISSDGEEFMSSGNSDENTDDNEDSSLCSNNEHVTSATSEEENESHGIELEETCSESISMSDISSNGEEFMSSGNSDENTDDNEDTSLCSNNEHVTSATSEEENESHGIELEETFDNNIKYIYVCKLCKAIFSSYIDSRKHRMEKHPRMSGTRLIKRISNYGTSSNGQNSKREDTKQLLRNDNLSYSDDGVIEDNIDKSCLRTRQDKEVNSDEEAIKASNHTLKKKKERITALFGDDVDVSARTKIKEKKSNQEGNKKQSSDILLTRNKDDVLSERIFDTDFVNTHENYPSVYGEKKQASDDKNTKISKQAVMKMKERLTMLFNDKDNNSEPKIVIENYDTEIEKINAENASNCFQGEVASEDERVNVSAHTVKRKQERTTKFFGNAECNESNTKLVEISEKHVGREYINENCGNKMHFQEITTENCRKKMDGNGDEVAVSNELVINDKNKINALNNVETKVHEDDQTEIDMIDCLLKELNSKPPENLGNDFRDVSGFDEQASEKNNGEIQDNVANHTSNLSVEVKTCLENIKITNVTSIAHKIYIYICQECHYATDDYDTVIRHCQNHYNDIEDPVINCPTCQIKYDAVCFKRHEMSHVRYFNSAKVNFSYKWLFINWSAVFDNMLLRDAEDIQVKSIYKTFCVKMVVKQNGPWQTSLYLCGKCNTCVPNQDIEKHVKQACCFINFPCSVCDRAFLTYDMKNHHEIYHEVDTSKQLKIIVFNDKLDERFNLKLSQAKSQAHNGEKEGVSDIFKCLCGLCYVSLKNFKLHFAECEEQVNNGINCPDCTVSRRFVPTELAEHLSLHHGTVKYNFRVQEIAFQDETNYNNRSKAAFNSPDAGIENGSPAEVEDSNTKRDTLVERHEISTQTTNYTDSHRDPVAIELDEEDLAVERDVLKDETLTQNTKDNDSQRDPEANEINEDDIVVEREILKETQNTNDNDSQRDPEPDELNEVDLVVAREISKHETLTQNTNNSGSQKGPEANEFNEEDIAVKRGMSKDEISTQNTNGNDSQRDPESVEFNVEDIAVKREMLKDETLTQTTNDNDSQSDPDSVEFNGEDMLKDGLLTQNTNENDSQSASKFAEPNDNKDLAAIELSSQEIMDVEEYEPLIPIDDSDFDSDIEFIE